MLFLNRMTTFPKIRFLCNAAILAILSFVFIFSCKTDNVKIYSNFNQYYPLKVGNYLIYNADSIKYYNASFSNKKPDTILYQVMDSIQSQFVDATGGTVYRIQESRRNSKTNPWIITRVFTRSINNLNAQEVDGNNRFIKLIFPVQLNRQWNPDLYNTTDSSHIFNAQYVLVHQPYTSQGLMFDSTVLVQLQADSTLISKNIYNERYASEIGLIRYEHDSVFLNTNGAGGDTTIEGFQYKQSLIDYGPHK